MPRDASGIYTLPSGNPVVTGTVISSEWANSTMLDIAAQLNNVMLRDGTVGLTDQFLLIDGTAAAPGLAFNSEATTGLFRPSAGVLGLSAGGVERLRLTQESTAEFSLNSGLWVKPDATHDARIALNKQATAGMNNGITGSTNGVARWAVLLGDITAESGANAGSDFQILRYPDTGTPAVGAVMLAKRSDGTVYIGNNLPDRSLRVQQQGASTAAILQSAGGSIIGMDCAVGAFSSFFGSKGSKLRWSLDMGDGTAESGGNAGSNFAIGRFNDAGAQIDAPIIINRATGIVTIKTSLAELKLESGTVADVIDALTARVVQLEGLL